MANVYAGSDFSFTGLFLTADGQPIIPVAPAIIQCFYFGADGSKYSFVPAGTVMSAMPANPGRYVYVAGIPDNLETNTEVYASMSVIDPDTDATVFIEQTVTVISNATSGAACGIRVAFVKPAGFQ